MHATHVRRLTAWDEFLVWWETRGELTSDVVTYYGLCSALGAIQGYWIGCQIVRYLG